MVVDTNNARQTAEKMLEESSARLARLTLSLSDPTKRITEITDTADARLQQMQSDPPSNPIRDMDAAQEALSFVRINLSRSTADIMMSGYTPGRDAIWTLFR